MRTQWVKCLPCAHEIPGPTENLCSAVHMCQHSTGRQRQGDSGNCEPASLAEISPHVLYVLCCFPCGFLIPTSFGPPIIHPPFCPLLPDSAFPPPAFSLCVVISPVCCHLPLRQHITTAPLWFLEVCQARHTSLKVRARTCI